MYEPSVSIARRNDILRDEVRDLICILSSISIKFSMFTSTYQIPGDTLKANSRQLNTISMLFLLPMLSVAICVNALVVSSPPLISSNLSQSTGIPYDLNTSSSSLLWGPPATNLSNVNAVLTRCIPESFGYNLRLESCLQALRSLNLQDEEPRSWGPRGTGVRYDYAMPQRFVSRTSFPPSCKIETKQCLCIF